MNQVPVTINSKLDGFRSILQHSPKRLDGVICERNYAEGPPHQPRPYARSWLGKLAGWSFANQLSTGISDEIVMPPGVGTPDLPYYRRNLVSTRYWGMAGPDTGRGMPRGWLVEDPLGLLR